jgi:hypothetical protein
MLADAAFESIAFPSTSMSTLAAVLGLPYHSMSPSLVIRMISLSPSLRDMVDMVEEFIFDMNAMSFVSDQILHSMVLFP